MRNHKVATCFFKWLIAVLHFPMPALSMSTFKMSRSQTIQKREIALFSYSDANFEDELKSDDTKT